MNQNTNARSLSSSKHIIVRECDKHLKLKGGSSYRGSTPLCTDQSNRPARNYVKKKKNGFDGLSGSPHTSTGMRYAVLSTDACKMPAAHAQEHT